MESSRECLVPKSIGEVRYLLQKIMVSSVLLLVISPLKPCASRGVIKVVTRGGGECSIASRPVGLNGMSQSLGFCEQDS